MTNISPNVRFPNAYPQIDGKTYDNFLQVQQYLEQLFGDTGSISAQIKALQTSVTTINGEITTIQGQITALQKLEAFETVSVSASTAITISSGTNAGPIDSGLLAFPITVPASGKVTVSMSGVFQVLTNKNLQVNWYSGGNLGAWATVNSPDTPPASLSWLGGFSYTWLLTGLPPGALTLYPSWDDNNGGASGCSVFIGSLGSTQGPFVMSGYPS